MMTVRSVGRLRVVIGTAVLALVATGCAIARVSVSSTGTEGNQESYNPLGVTDDGRYSLFDSNADDLVPGDTNGKPDVFRHDAQTGATVRVDVAPNGSPLTDGAFGGGLSASGRWVAFRTVDALVPADTNGVYDVYVRDLLSNTTTWASVPPPGGLPVTGAESSTISADGRYVSFRWGSGYVTSGSAVFRRDRQLGVTEKTKDYYAINHEVISRDGHHLADMPGCFQGGCFPLPHLFDLDGSGSGWPALQFPTCPFDSFDAMSPDGRYLILHAFQQQNPPFCLAQGQYLVDRTTGTATRLSLPDGLAASSVGLSRDARAVVYVAGRTPDTQRLHLRNLVTGADSLLDVTLAGQEPDDLFPVSAVLSDDGTQVEFDSPATNLVPADHNGVRDLFVRPTGLPPSP